ncbi:MAG: hypothetical protein N3B13_09145, partial [Deltaproteobacteria bacterium]|nr:hypothetical protein [Deltaproteobacteria bacterium]
MYLPTKTTLPAKILPVLAFLVVLILLNACPPGSKIYFTLVRYNPDGSIDRTFGKDGIVVTKLEDISQLFSLALDSEGRIIAGGTTGDKYAVVRDLPDGSIDRLFGKNGRFAEDFGADFAMIKKVIPDKDGKILAAGHHSIRDGKKEKYSEMSVIRLNSDGTPDLSFGNKGISLVNINNGRLRTYSIATQSDGKILLAGTYDSFFEILRFNQDGSRDTLFGKYAGMASIESSSHETKALDIIVSDDRIIVAGASGDSITKYILDKNGFITSQYFGLLRDFGPYFEINSVMITPKGNVIAAGTTFENEIPVSFVLLNISFEEDGVTANGKTIFSIISDKGPDTANTIAVQPDEKIILGGSTSYD